ncbi:ras-related and estrogen-regulated growth inhibitor-like protein isoform X2 [Babylonia areolata]|uniref:ras-related and estrogen-regulated growth inhibitor-like protein isoform X2 n=1 Tax=Babylonia areolata TaxID=304850 RepID=UPI003FD1711D
MKNPVHIIILGQEGVGKSALAVRFLTRRFLSEFAETEEMSYERTVTLDDDRQVSLRLTDVSGKSLQTRAASRELLMQADAAVLVYSVTDQSSVVAARHALGCIRKYRPNAPSSSAASSSSSSSSSPALLAPPPSCPAVTQGNRLRAPPTTGVEGCPPLPVLLLGNKCDLDHIRTVQRHSTASDWTPDCTMTSECSARDDVDGVTSLFQNLIKKVLEIREASQRSGRKLSQGVLGSPRLLRSTIKRRLSVFSRDRVSTL